MLSDKLQWTVKNESGNIVAMKLVTGEVLVSNPDQAVNSCLNDLANLYSLDPDTTGMLLYVEKIEL